MLVVEKYGRQKITVKAESPSLVPVFFFLGDQHDETRVCMVFRNGIKTGRSNLAA